MHSILHRIFDAGRYSLYIYEERISSSLSPEDQTWADALIARTQE